MRVPAGYRILEATLIADDLDSNGTPLLALNFGYDEPGGTNDPDAFVVASQVARAGGIVRVENGGDDPFAVGILPAGALTREIVVVPSANAATAAVAAGNVTVILKLVPNALPAPLPNAYLYRDRYGSDSNSAN
jgi:hypothetical protein